MDLRIFWDSLLFFGFEGVFGGDSIDVIGAVWAFIGIIWRLYRKIADKPTKVNNGMLLGISHVLARSTLEIG